MGIFNWQVNVAKNARIEWMIFLLFNKYGRKTINLFHQRSVLQIFEESETLQWLPGSWRRLKFIHEDNVICLRNCDFGSTRMKSNSLHHERLIAKCLKQQPTGELVRKDLVYKRREQTFFSLGFKPNTSR